MEAGRCELENYLLVQAGSFLLSGGPIAIRPLGFCRAACIALSGLTADRISAQLDAPLVLLPTAYAGGLYDAVALLRALADPALQNPARQNAMGYELLCRLAALHPTGRQMPPLVEDAIGLIRARYADVYGVEELAMELSVSKGHLIRAFTSALGITPGRYLMRVRLEAVKQLLLHREYSLEVVAGLCGFSGANYLCRVFKKEEGASPNAWRRANASAGAPILRETLPPPVLEEGLYL